MSFSFLFQENYIRWKEHQSKQENWVISEILTRPDLTERTLALKKFIDMIRVRIIFIRWEQ